MSAHEVVEFCHFVNFQDTNKSGSCMSPEVILCLVELRDEEYFIHCYILHFCNTIDIISLSFARKFIFL